MPYQEHPFLQLTLPRVTRALQRVQAMIWQEPHPVRVGYAGSKTGDFGLEQARRRKLKPVALPFHWGHLNEIGWFRLELPEPTDERPRYLQWVDQGEGTLYIGGVPYYGFDVAHREVRLPAGCHEAWMESLCLQSGIWHQDAKGLDPQGSRLAQAQVVVRNDIAWKVWHDLDVLSNLTIHEGQRSPDFGGVHQGGVGYKPEVANVSVLLRRLLRALDDAVNALDRGGLAGIEASLATAWPLLSEPAEPIRSILTGHAHIDLVWLWPERSGEYKARHTFAIMNRLLQDYPETRFAYSQSASYDAVAASAPALFEQVKERVAEGTWEPVGATYVEMDTILPCGEALVRAFLVGQERFRAHFGTSSNILWLPDVFGYSGCLPQIMRQCGVENFFTTKLTWSNINRFPHSSFVWRGTDGSEVLTHVTQELGYNQTARPEEARVAARAYRQSDVHGAFLQPVGFGDGGGGVTPVMCERARRMQNLGGVPHTSWGRLDDFFADLEKARPRLPTYQGELYLEYHRGTYTTHGNLKAIFRGLERALQAREAAHSLVGAGPVPVHAWQRLIFSQFHDYIPGSSVHEVYEEGLPELARLASEQLAAVPMLLGRKKGGQPTQALFNPLPLPRPYFVEGPAGPGIVHLPPVSVSRPDLLPLSRPALSPEVNGNELRGDRVVARFNDQGEVVSLVIDGQEVANGAPLNQLATYPDFPHGFDAWDIDRQTLGLGEVHGGKAERVESPACAGSAGVAFRKSIGENSTVWVHYRIDAALPVLQVDLEVDWKDGNRLLKALMPTHYKGRFSRQASPYGSVLRGQQSGESRHEAMFETCASRWAVVMDDSQSEGLALISEAKYGHSCRDGLLGLSLLRSVLVTGYDPGHDKAVTPTLRSGPVRRPLSDYGIHRIKYAIGRFAADLPRGDSPAALADLLYTPTLAVGNAPIRQGGLLGFQGGESLVPAWAKPLADGSWILRLHETLGRAGTMELVLATGWKARRTTLAESEGGEAGTSVTFGPYEIVSLRLSPPGQGKLKKAKKVTKDA